MFDLTRHNIINTMAGFAVLFILFWGGAAADAQLVPPSGVSGYAAGVWIDGVFLRLPELGYITAFILLFACAYRIMRVFIRFSLAREKSYMPMLVCMLVSSGFCAGPALLKTIVSAFFLILATEKLIRSYKKERSNGYIFESAVMTGLAAVVYPPCVFFFLLVPVGLLVFRLFSVREWVIALAGFAVTAFLYAYGIFCFRLLSDARVPLGDIFWGLWGDAVRGGALPGTTDISVIQWLFAIAVTVVMFFSLVSFVRNRRYMENRSEKAMVLYLAMLLIQTAMFLLPSHSLDQLPLLAVPLSVVVPVYFCHTNPGFMTNFLYLMLFVPPLLSVIGRLG